MFSLHSFFLLFFPTSAFVPATVFLVAIFLALRLFVSMTQMTILADFFPHQCTVWQWADTTWGDLQAGLVTAPEANLPVPSGACLSFTCRWLNGTCLPLPPPSPTHTHTHTHTHTVVGFSQPRTVQCSIETHQNTWKWQSEHQEPVSNDIFNHQGFPSKPCLSVFSNC